MKYILILIVLQLSVNQLFSQKMFEQQFSNCPLKFTLEDSEMYIYYESDDSIMVVDFLSGLEQKHIDKLKGVVMMQIMVDTANQICCVSYTNKTTLSNKRLDIPNRLSLMKGWKKLPDVLPGENICALVSIIFDKKEITVMRTGYNRNRGRKIIQSVTFKRYVEIPEKKPEQAVHDSLINKQ